MSTLLVTISRTSLSLSPLVLSGSDDANPIGVTNFTEPAQQARIKWAPASDYQHGDVALAAAYQQAVLGFDVVTDQAATEAASRLLLAELRAAIAQFSFTVAVVIDGAPVETWACNTGSMTPLGSRSYLDLQGHDPEWQVSIPCHPIPTIGA